MKNLTKVALGILTSVGGYLEVGSIGTALQAGAAYRYSLLWALALGTICIAFLTEMSGRLAAVSHHSVVAAMRERFGISFQIWPLLAQIVVDLFVLASEVGGASLALQLMTGVSIRVWAIPVALLIWCLLWFATFSTIENGVAILGLVTLSFVVVAIKVVPSWGEVARGLLPARAPFDPAQYAYAAVGILGATISPYLVTFYSSGAIEEKWSAKDLAPNRAVSAFGMTFGGAIGMAVLVAAAVVLRDRGILADSYAQSAPVLALPLGRWGFPLFCASLFVGCVGAALELALDVSYIVSQTLGWDWGANVRPANEARFALVYTLALPIAIIPSLAGIDPLKLTMFSMALTVLALPVVIGPLIVLMNDRQYLQSHTNGWVTNVAVVSIVALGFVLAGLAIPVQLLGGA